MLLLDMSYLMKRQCDVVGEVAAEVGASGGSCLELGCAAGDALPFLQEIFSRVVAVDISQEKVDLARGKVRPGGEVQRVGGWGRGPITYPFEDRSFDVVVSFSLLHHLDAEARRQVVREARRMIRPGGAVVFLEYNPINPLALLTVALGPEDRGARPLLMNSMKALFRQSGLRTLRGGYVLLFPRTLSLLSPVEDRLRRIPLGGKYFLSGTRE